MLKHAIAVTASLVLACGSAAAAEVPKKKSQPRAQQRVAVKDRLQCKVGPYEKQTRLVMETVKGKPVYLAYWSSNGPFHCSFESWPGDGRAQWLDSSAGMVISLISGTLLVEDDKTHYTITAREVDRMAYCGTTGVISGVLKVPKNKRDCTWEEKSSEEAAHLD